MYVRLRALALAAAALAGIGGGIGSYAFVYAKGFSYMRDDPAVCANCHIMQGHYDAFLKSSHKDVAVCNDCHTPHNFAGKYYAKGRNGMHHSWAFTTGYFHEPIRITEWNKSVTEDACRYCHNDIVEQIDCRAPDMKPLACIRCHDTVGHDE